MATGGPATAASTTMAAPADTLSEVATTGATAFADDKETSSSKTVASPINTTKAESHKLLKQIWFSTNVGDAHALATRIVELYDGKGLHPLSAVRALGTYPTGFDAAVDLLFEIVEKIVQCHGHEHKVCVMAKLSLCRGISLKDQQAFWTSIRRSKGKYARYFKDCDRTLASLIATQWKKLAEGVVSTENTPARLFDRTTRLWATLLDQISHSHIKEKHLSTDRPRIFKFSRWFLFVARKLHTNNIKARKVARDRLPQELVDIIAEYLLWSEPPLNMATFKRITGLDTFQTSQPAGGERELMRVYMEKPISGLRVASSDMERRQQELQKTRSCLRSRVYGDQSTVAPTLL